MTVDAYVWANNADTGEASTYLGYVNELTHGFSNLHPNWWEGSDLYDDDLMWATIAFVRASDATGSSTYLILAEDAFNTVYNRGLLSNGGIVWYAGGCTGHPITGGCVSSYETQQPTGPLSLPVIRLASHRAIQPTRPRRTASRTGP
jgi:Glycosyl hydrolase family 76